MKPEFKIVKKPEGCAMVTTGDLIVQFSEQFKNHLQHLSAEAGVLELSLTEVTSIDVSAIQLIHAFKIFVDSIQKKLVILSPKNVEVTELLTRTGLIRMVSNEKSNS